MPVFEQPSSNMHLLFSKCWYDQISIFLTIYISPLYSNIFI